MLQFKKKVCLEIINVSSVCLRKCLKLHYKGLSLEEGADKYRNEELLPKQKLLLNFILNNKKSIN